MELLRSLASGLQLLADRYAEARAEIATLEHGVTAQAAPLSRLRPSARRQADDDRAAASGRLEDVRRQEAALEGLIAGFVDEFGRVIQPASSERADVRGRYR